VVVKPLLLFLGIYASHFILDVLVGRMLGPYV